MERSSTRDRLLSATVSLMRTKGAAGSGTKEILDLAQAPRGSFYFHFPGGKDELVLEALTQAAAATYGVLSDATADESVGLAEQIRGVFSGIERELFDEDFGPGCAVGVTTVESAAVSPVFQQAVHEAFGSWTTLLTTRMIERGIDSSQAPALADTIVAAMEGATILARAHRDPTPLRNTGAMLRVLIDAISTHG